MKHFFEQSAKLSPSEKNQILEMSRQELKQSPMNFNEMSTQQLLFCFNASSANQYIPRGMESLISTQIVPVTQSLNDTDISQIKSLLRESSDPVLGYVFENLQVKEIHNYLDLCFRLETDFQFDPVLVYHFSYDELVTYLQDFLKAAVLDNSDRSIDVYDDRQNAPWKTLRKSGDLESVDKGIKQPAVIERPFFSDIHFNVVKQGRNQVIQSAFGQLKGVQQFFGKSKIAGGELIRSKNKLYFKWKDINRLKLGTTQAKSLLGVTVKGEFIGSSQLVTHDIALKMIEVADIDAFRFKINKKPVDVPPQEITQMEVNLDTQQMTLIRSITEDEFHIGRFRRLKLNKGESSVQIHKVIPFNRGESNFEQIQTFFGTRYTEYEKARSILRARGEYGLLATRNIAAGDLVSHMVLSSMKLLGYLPFDIHCIGFKPEDVKNLKVSRQDATEWVDAAKKNLTEIIDVSQTPSFTEHNFNRRSKAIRSFINTDKQADITPEQLEAVIRELEELIQYMDDFFKLNVYRKLEDDLECETVTGLEDDLQADDPDAGGETENTRLDDESKQFITQNYAFFEKRDQIENTLIRIEKILFYHRNVKAFSENQLYEPDLIIYRDADSQFRNYQFASYPALPLSKALELKSLQFQDHDHELRFVKFMRGFTGKTHQKALELNKSFHHQFKHTLSELTFIADEKLLQLTDELRFLETPENREAAYKNLLEKITALYHQHLKEKEDSIQALSEEYQQVAEKFNTYKTRLEELTGETYTETGLQMALSAMPQQLEKLKKEILEEHKIRIRETSPVFNAYMKLYSSAIGYFRKNLEYANLFLKALWLHRNKSAFQIVRKQTEGLFGLDKAVIQQKIDEYRLFKYDQKKEEKAQQSVHALTRKIKETLIELSKIPVKGLFRDAELVKGDLFEYLDYYKRETDILCGLISQLHPTYQQLSKLQNQLFKQQEELVAIKLEKTKNDLRLKICHMILENPDCQAAIDDLEKQSEKVPEEIKNELGQLRAILVETVNQFKAITTPEKLQQIADYHSLIDQAKRRRQINETAKELVNFAQGLQAIQQEKSGEIADLEYLRSQESTLEQVALSKALPSTRILLKTKYIPMVEREKKLLVQANQFLSEIISNEKAINQALVSTFFQKRYGVLQFSRGSYCLDISSGAKDHTERNIYSAFMLIAERFPKAFAETVTAGIQPGIKKLEIKGIEGMRNLISQIWHGHVDARFLFLPSSFNFVEALEMCEYKDSITKNNVKTQRSRNSLILIYVHKINFEEIERSPEQKARYNQAILSNIFINVDGKTIFNNRDSIYDACIRETFGKCHDKFADQVMQSFLFS